jgi:hypothetical protein
LKEQKKEVEGILQDLQGLNWQIEDLAKIGFKNYKQFLEFKGQVMKYGITPGMFFEGEESPYDTTMDDYLGGSGGGNGGGGGTSAITYENNYFSLHYADGAIRVLTDIKNPEEFMELLKELAQREDTG